jgi:hypothetical protein
MTEGPVAPQTLAAKSPFELRVNLGKSVPEVDVRTALAKSDIRFLQPITTAATVVRSGVPAVPCPT